MENKKFNKVAEIYEKYRPKYPNEYIKYLIKQCKLNQNSLIVDVGAGTGIFTKQLLDENLKVIAVEPNNDMRKVLKEKLKNNKNFKLVVGTAENTNIEENTADLITVAQAFHWFNIEDFRKECKRILKPNGKVCIIWNKLDINDIIVKEQKNIDYKYTNQYKEINNILQDEKREDLVKKFFQEGKYECKVTKNDLENDKEKFIGVNLSKSYSIRKGEEKYEEYVKEFEKLFEKYNKDGIILIKNNTYGYLGELK